MTLYLVRHAVAVSRSNWQGDYEDPAQSWALAHLLGSKGIPNRMDSWGKDYRHDWNTWRAMW